MGIFIGRCRLCNAIKQARSARILPEELDADFTEWDNQGLKAEYVLDEGTHFTEHEESCVKFANRQIENILPRLALEAMEG